MLLRFSSRSRCLWAKGGRVKTQNENYVQKMWGGGSKGTLGCICFEKRGDPLHLDLPLDIWLDYFIIQGRNIAKQLLQLNFRSNQKAMLTFCTFQVFRLERQHTKQKHCERCTPFPIFLLTMFYLTCHFLLLPRTGYVQPLCLQLLDRFSNVVAVNVCSRTSLQQPRVGA